MEEEQSCPKQGGGQIRTARCGPSRVVVLHYYIYNHIAPFILSLLFCDGRSDICTVHTCLSLRQAFERDDGEATCVR